MVRLVLFVAALCAAAIGFSVLADSPGRITIDWFGTRIETTAFIAAIAVLATVVVSIGLWQLVRFLLTSPRALKRTIDQRRREKGLDAIGRGLVAVGAGDSKTAQRAADDARRALGAQPTVLLLQSQAAQLAGDRASAVSTFESMLKDPETRPLGYRGLYVEAQRAGDVEAARRAAEAAHKARPGLPWAANAVLAFQAGARDWDGALSTIRSNADNRLIDRADAKRLRAVVLTAKAMEAEATDRARARALALEAHGLAPDLIPAAEIAARLLSEAGDVRRATKVIETTWRQCPHPDLADAYMHARMGDAARDRLRRARALLELAPNQPEGRMAVATAAMEARDFAEARRVLQPLLERPTRRACMLMAMIAEAEDNVGESREWLGRAARAAPDPAWTADGYVSDRWLPVSPVTAKLDAFKWRSPMEAAPGAAIPAIAVPTIPAPIGADVPLLPPAAPAPVVAEEAEPAPEPPPEAAAPAQPPAVEVEPAPPREETPQPRAVAVAAPAPEAAVAVAPPPPEAEPPPLPASAEAAKPEPQLEGGNVVRLPIIPDDPGPEPRPRVTEPARRRFGIF
jgi:HemY protein